LKTFFNRTGKNTQAKVLHVSFRIFVLAAAHAAERILAANYAARQIALSCCVMMRILCVVIITTYLFVLHKR